jgi:hypothetical protein
MLFRRVPISNQNVAVFDKMLHSVDHQKALFSSRSMRDEDGYTFFESADMAHMKMMKYFDVSSDQAIVAVFIDPRFKLYRYFDEIQDEQPGATRLVRGETYNTNNEIVKHYYDKHYKASAD